ncbi:MAG: BatD family protein [Candidatus Marinimicrobia bacterium]|nr:BatD family protein [Candidatus Neomarinimicrobiota bacterium]
MKKFLKIFLFFAFIPGLFAQAITTTVEPDSGYIGDIFTVTYRITLPEKVRITAPPFERSLANFKLLSQSSDIHVDNKTYTRIYTLTLTALDTGTHVIPPVAFTIHHENMLPEKKDPFILESDAVPITLLSTLSTLETPPDIYKPLPISVFTRKQKILLLILATLLILVIFFGFFRKRAILSSRQEKNAITSPYKEAIQSLDALEKKSYPQKKAWKAFYGDLTTILKHYLERTFFLHLSDLPTADLIPLLKNELSHIWTDEITNLLQFSDLVKFARYETNPEQCMRDLQIVRAWCKKVEMSLTPQIFMKENEKSS